MSIQPQEQSLPVRRAYRRRDGAWLGGVCVGIAEHLGWPVLLVRVAFVILGGSKYVGIVGYAALWLMLPEKQQLEAPGLEAASRQGMRTRAAKRLGSRDIGMIVALIALGLGLLALIQNLGLGLADTWFWPVAAACVGLALLWRQADSSQVAATSSLRGFLTAQGWAGVARMVAGLVLVVAAITTIGVNQIGSDVLPKAIMVVVCALGGVLLVVAPWLHRYQVQLRAAHEQQVLADQKADMAAHLHDSVLQTLALIQRQASDPQAVTKLARTQERELRTWLYGDQIRDTTLAAALRNAAASVEDDTTIKVEVVTVGDCELDDDSRATVQAAREAMMNAAKHSGAAVVDVYAEVEDGSIEVFVRDRGKGFDLDTIGGDRQGIRRSIFDRMERHGGAATIRSEPGEGTEVRLELRHDRSKSGG